MKTETSKLLLFIDFTIAIILTGVVVIGAFTGVDMSNVTVISGLWDAQLGVVIGAYMWKSKNENRSKHAMQLVRDLAEKYGFENVVNLAEVILKD